MGIHIADVLGRYARTLQATQQRTGRTLYVRRRDMVTIARESPAKDLAQDGSTTAYGMLIAFDDERGSTTTGHQSVAVAVERAAGLGGLVDAGGEGLQGVKRGDAVHVVLFCSAADDAVLQAVLDQQEAQTQRLRTTGTGCRCCQIDTFQVKQRGQVHRHRRIHRLENGA